MKMIKHRMLSEKTDAPRRIAKLVLITISFTLLGVLTFAIVTSISLSQESQFDITKGTVVEKYLVQETERTPQENGKSMLYSFDMKVTYKVHIKTEDPSQKDIFGNAATSWKEIDQETYDSLEVGDQVEF